MSAKLVKREGFGTSPVFFTAISTILGAILFLRLGYAVGNLGLLGAMGLIVLGHLIAIPTALSISEIATNQRVEGGREYYIISRSFGIAVGGAIGLALYLSQAIGAAFYIVAFAEAFKPIFDALLASEFNIYIYDYRIVSVPAMVLLGIFTLTQRSSVGVRSIYLVSGILFIALAMFLIGGPTDAMPYSIDDLGKHIDQPDDFFSVFAICFPAFTGMTAGVGLASDLKNPSKSIPKGTIYATLVGFVIYLAVIFKLYFFVSPEELANKDNLVMSNIATWGPIIPIGLGAATLTSAIGSLLVAPRTLQAIATDKILPSVNANRWLKRLSHLKGEPKNAMGVTLLLTSLFVLIGDVDIIAQIVTICFLITYGGICTVSFLEHFTADPTYRPAFKSHWFISMLGALTALLLILKIYSFNAALPFVIIFGIYYAIDRFSKEEQGLSAIFQGVIFQLNRQLHVFLQKAKKAPESDHWRPSIVCVSNRTFENFSAFDLLRWISYRYGFGTYIHRIDGYLSTETHQTSLDCLDRMIKMAEGTDSNVYLDTFISPSITAALSAIIQLPGMSGKENNMLMFEFDKNDPQTVNDIIDNFPLVRAVGFDTCVLGASGKNFGYKKNIDIYLTSNDIDNANLMIMLGFILLGHPDWKGARIKLLPIYFEHEIAEQRSRILQLIDSGRLPISRNNVELIPKKDDMDIKGIINEKSKDACLTIIGIREEAVKHNGQQVFTGYDSLGDILFVNAKIQREIN